MNPHILTAIIIGCVALGASIADGAILLILLDKIMELTKALAQ